ncbi:MAG: hypothetical protein U0802_02675 [Candidatus Binatia bacterium]
MRGDGVTLNGNERDATLHLDGEIELARLALLDEALQVVHGTAHLDGVLSGPLERPVLSASVTIPDSPWAIGRSATCASRPASMRTSSPSRRRTCAPPAARSRRRPVCTSTRPRRRRRESPGAGWGCAI